MFDKRLGLIYVILVHNIVTFDVALGLQGPIVLVLYNSDSIH